MRPRTCGVATDLQGPPTAGDQSQSPGPTLSPMRVGSIARRARGSNDWRVERAAMSDAIRRKPDVALKIAHELDEDLERHGYDLAISALRHDAFELACQSPPRSSTRIAIHLGARPSTQHPNSPKPEYLRLRNAMQIAGTRPAADIMNVLESDQKLRREDPEFGLLLSHELVLRGTDPSASAAWYRTWARETNHPLAPLPFQLLDIEREIPTGLPQYPGALGASSWPTTTIIEPELVPLGEFLSGLGAGIPLDDRVAMAPFQDWLDLSNGRVQVAAYRPGDAFAADLPEPRVHEGIRATPIDPAQAVRSLFIAASGGGAYSPSPGGATARLRVWAGLGALVDLSAASPLEEIAQRAGDAQWLRLETSDWFDEVAWDVWIVLLGGQRVVTVAATDTD